MRDIEFMWAGGYTDRYHTSRTLLRDTVGHHSFNVACTIMHVHPKASAALLRAALLHDVAEQVTGDMPAPAKRDMGIRVIFTEYEEDVMAKAGVDFPTLTEDEEWLLSYADAVDGMRFCIQERSMGNKRVEEIYHNYTRYVADLLDSARCQPKAITLFNYMKEKWNDAVS